MDKTEGFQCLGPSNWTICSPLSQFCSDIFQTFSLSYWGANSYYPRGLIIGVGRETLKVNKHGESQIFTRSTNRQISADIEDITSCKGRQAFIKSSSSSWTAREPWPAPVHPSFNRIRIAFLKMQNVERRSSIPAVGAAGKERHH